MYLGNFYFMRSTEYRMERCRQWSTTRKGNHMRQRFCNWLSSTLSWAHYGVHWQACRATGVTAGFVNCFGGNDNENETLASSVVLRQMTKPTHIALVANLFHPQTGEECIIQSVVDALGSKQSFQNCLSHPNLYSLSLCVYVYVCI